MKDRIPTYPGRVKLTPVSGQTNTYDMVRADEPVQEGTPLNKNTLLRDATAEALGLTADATVDEALGALNTKATNVSNNYMWATYKAEWQTQETATTSVSTALSSALTFQYSTDIEILQDGTIQLVNPTLVSAQCSTTDDVAAFLPNKYVEISGTICLVHTATKAIIGEKVTIEYSELDTIFVEAFSGYVNSPDENAYPPATSDGFTYKALGKIGEKVKIETGSYVGTGTCGYSYPNSITFGGIPKLVFISRSGFLEINGSGQPQNSVLWQDLGDGETTPGTVFAGTTTGGSFTRNGNTLKWQINTNESSTGAAQAQLNSSGYTYYYFAVLK